MEISGGGVRKIYLGEKKKKVIKKNKNRDSPTDRSFSVGDSVVLENFKVHESINNQANDKHKTAHMLELEAQLMMQTLANTIKQEAMAIGINMNIPDQKWHYDVSTGKLIRIV